MRHNPACVSLMDMGIGDASSHLDLELLTSEPEQKYLVDQHPVSPAVFTHCAGPFDQKPERVGQSRRGSLHESLVNIAVGYSINYVANMLIFPHFGWNISTRENLTLGVIYTGISLVRSYGLRRFFNYRDFKK